MHNETFYTKKNINEFKIALISDIHYYKNFNQKTLNKMYNQIKTNKPNNICITGDTLDNSKTTELDRLITFLNKISSIAPVLIVLGNHEKKCGSMWKWHEKENTVFTNAISNLNNVHLLRDKIWQNNNISFYGFDLSFDYYEKHDEDYNQFIKEIETLKTTLSEENYNITLFHSPKNIYNYIEKNPNSNLAKSDLILSGHMHNGCLPFFISNPINKLFKTNRSLIDPTRKLFPKYSQGRVYKIKDGYIHEGITKLSHSTRFFHYFDWIFQKNVEFLKIKKDK